MNVVHLTQRDLAERWHVSEATIERMRSEGKGPRFIKLAAKILYRVVDVEAYEDTRLMSSTKVAASPSGPRSDGETQKFTLSEALQRVSDEAISAAFRSTGTAVQR